MELQPNPKKYCGIKINSKTIRYYKKMNIQSSLALMSMLFDLQKKKLKANKS